METEEYLENFNRIRNEYKNEKSFLKAIRHLDSIYALATDNLYEAQIFLYELTKRNQRYHEAHEWLQNALNNPYIDTYQEDDILLKKNEINIVSNFIFEPKERTLENLYAYYDGVVSARFEKSDLIVILRFLEREGSKNNIQAQFTLAFLLENITEFDSQQFISKTEKAIRWYKKAADEGMTDAYYRLAKIYFETKVLNMEYSARLFLSDYYFRRAVENEHVDAMRDYANAILKGQMISFELNKDFVEQYNLVDADNLNYDPVELLEDAVELGDCWSALDLSKFFAEKENYPESLFWSLVAGHITDDESLGVLFLDRLIKNSKVNMSGKEIVETEDRFEQWLEEQSTNGSFDSDDIPF